MANDEVTRGLSLIQELDVSVLTIEAGLAELQASVPGRPRHFVFLLLLATGIERLAKVVLHLRAMERDGKPLPPAVMRPGKGYGHDLVRLVDAVVDQCFTPEHLARPVAVQDRDFLRHDPLFRSMLSLLSDFATNSRYVYMDGISDPASRTEPPARRWDELERSATAPEEHARLYATGDVAAAKRHATGVLAARIERFVRAVARLFVFGALGSLGRQVSTELAPYYRLDDDQLGH